MPFYELTFRFDDADNSLDRFNGLSIGDLAKFLKALNQSVSGNDERKLVLSEIKGNCYAPVISTANKTTHEQIKFLHSEISNGNLSGLNANEKRYYKTLREITKDRLILSIYDQDKSFFKSIERMKDIDVFPYFFQTNSYRGFLTRIGGRNLHSRNTIFISSYATEVEIDGNQDSLLREYYKNHLLEFYLTEKVNKDTGNIESAELDNFEVVGKGHNTAFSQNIEKVRAKFGNYFMERIKNEENE